MFEMARRFLGVINVISKVALKLGSSQHGKACRQSEGYQRTYEVHDDEDNGCVSHFKLCTRSIAHFVAVRYGVLISIETSHAIVDLADECQR